MMVTHYLKNSGDFFFFLAGVYAVTPDLIKSAGMRLYVCVCVCVCVYAPAVF